MHHMCRQQAQLVEPTTRIIVAILAVEAMKSWHGLASIINKVVGSTCHWSRNLDDDQSPRPRQDVWAWGRFGGQCRVNMEACATPGLSQGL